MTVPSDDTLTADVRIQPSTPLTPASRSARRVGFANSGGLDESAEQLAAAEISQIAAGNSLALGSDDDNFYFA
jgi:hypothetical protein